MRASNDTKKECFYCMICNRSIFEAEAQRLTLTLGWLDKAIDI
ncbi:hypothetical protein [Paenibacillus sp. FSL K6-2859]